MKYTNELMLMIARFLHGELDAQTFSFDFPARLDEMFDVFHAENTGLCEYLEDEMPELCAAYDAHGTGDPGTLDADQLRERVLAVYKEALPLSMRPAS